MKQYASFRDRADAGERLAKHFSYLSDQRLVVSAVPNGGVPIGIEIAKKFSCPLDLILVHKLYPPNHPETGFGAITIDGTVELNHQSVKKLGLSQPEIEKITHQTFEILKRRKEKFLKGKPAPSLLLRIVLLVDDGIASGYTMLTAIRTVKKKNPKKIILAVPTSSAQGLNFVKNEVDETFSLYLHPEHFPYKIKSSYQNWHRLTDDQVETILENYS